MSLYFRGRWANRRRGTNAGVKDEVENAESAARCMRMATAAAKAGERIVL